MKALVLAALLAVPAAASAAATPDPAVAAEVQKGVAAYNAGDIAYYKAVLADDAVYIADDGGTFAGKERVVGLFTRLFASDPAPKIAIEDVVTGSRGEVGWARFHWTITRGESARKGIASVLFVRAGDHYQVLQIQNTPAEHAMRRH